MKKQFVFKQFSPSGLEMTTRPLLSIGASFIILGLFIFIFKEVLIFFIASIFIILGIFFISLGLKAWFSGFKDKKKRSYGETEIIE